MPPSRTWPNASSSWLCSDHLAVERLRALGDHDDRRVLVLEPLLDVAGDLVDVELPLRQQDHVGATGEAGVQRDPAGVPAHHLDHQRAVVRLGGGVQPVDRLHRDVDRGVEAEGVVGRAEVVVDRLRHADDVDAQVGAAWSRRRGCPRRRSRSSASTPSSARFALIFSTPPSILNGLVREEPRMVPPRGRMPRTSAMPSGMV